MNSSNLRIKNYTFVLVAVLICAVIGFAACSRTIGVEKVNKNGDGLAVRGYDTVAYFAEQSAVLGDPSFEYVWNGAKWLFANAANLERFKQDPESFAPQYGGYCSYAVSQGYTADGDPQVWKIVDGMLFLNYNQKAREAWEKEQDKFIKDGHKNWSEFQTKKPEHKG